MGTTLVVINGKPRIAERYQLHWCEVERLSDGWYIRRELTGEWYAIVWFRDGTKVKVYSQDRYETPNVEIRRPSGRWVLNLVGQEVWGRWDKARSSTT